MNDAPRRITLAEWDERHAALLAQGLREPWYGGPLGRHVSLEGDLRLRSLRFDNSPAALRLWNFLLTEEERLREARERGKKLVGAMKDLGTVPVMAYSLPNLVAFYPDGAWWIPCVMEMSDGLFRIADSLGVDESFCPVRAMLGAFLTGAHFPIPDLLTCSVGATCDDFSAIAQRLNDLGHPILWWEAPHRRGPTVREGREAPPLQPGCCVANPPSRSGLCGDVRGGDEAADEQVELVKSELGRVREALESLSGMALDDERLRAGIREANRVRALLTALQQKVYSEAGALCPMPALEMLIAEMLAIHFCSDREEATAVLEDLVAEVDRRIKCGQSVLASDAARIFWVNPVADLRVMNLLEECGGRVCGTEYLFRHAIDPIPVDRPPMEALARMVLEDPMVGPADRRARLVCRLAAEFGAEALIISRIPGASHCATEGEVMREAAEEHLGIPTAEIEVPPLSDAMASSLRSRMEALIEVVRDRRVRK
jgi:hypothetical protein